MAKPAPAAPRESGWDALIGATACAGAFLVPFFPDEKLTRAKLQALELWILGLLLVISLRLVARREAPGVLTQPDGAPGRRVALAVLAWLGVNAALASLSEWSLSGPELLRVATAVAAFAALYLSGLSAAWFRRFLLSWSASAALLSIYGLLQLSGGVGIIAVPQFERIMGTFGNPIFFSAFLLSSLFVTAAARCEVKGSAGRVALNLCIGLEFAALVATQTRSAWLALVAGLIWAAAGFGRRPRPGTLVLAAVALGVVLFATRPMWGRDQAHGLIWRDTVALWRTKPVTGVGLGAFHVHFQDVAQKDLKAKWPPGKFVVNEAHNEYLQTLAEGGPFALVAFLAIFGFFKMAARRAGPAPEPAEIWLSTAVAAAMVQNIFSVDFRFVVSFASTFGLLGLGASLAVPPWRRWEAAGGRGRAVLPALGLIGLVAAGGTALWRTRWFNEQRAVQNAPGFFDERLLDPARTIADLEKLAADHPSEPDVLEKLAFAYAKEMKRPDGSIDPETADKAVRTYRRVIRLDNARTSAHNNIGNVLFTMGRQDEAIAEWGKAASLDPNFLDPRLNLGKAMFMRGNLSDASKRFGEVLKIDPRNAEAKLYLRRMVE